jgi:uncharacterized protein YdgA (DUF945 family)
MNKAVVFGAAAVVVLGGGYIGAAAYSGNVVQQEYEAALDEVGQALPFIKIVDRQYDKGLFSATASYGLQLGCASLMGGKPVTLVTLRQTIAHGPLPGFAGVGSARIDTEIVLPENAPEGLRQWFANMKPEAIRTLIGYGGEISARIEIPEGEIKERDVRLHWQAMHLAFKRDGEQKASSVDYTIPEITFEFNREGKAGHFKLVNLHGQSANESAGDALFGNSSGTATLDQLQIAAAGGGKGDVLFDFSQIKGATTQKMENDLLAISSSLTGAASLKVGDRSFKLDKIEMQESFKRLHAPTLQKIVLGLWQELRGVCSKTPDELKQSWADKEMEMLVSLKALLPYNLEYSLDKFAITYEGHEGSLAYSVAANGITVDDLQQPDMSFLIGKVATKASARLPIAWLKKIAAEKSGVKDVPQGMLDTMIGQLVDTGYVTREGDFITSAASFEQGQLTVNGKVLDNSSLLGALLGLRQQDDADEEDGDYDGDGDED